MRVHISTDQGTVIDTLFVEEYDLSQQFARTALFADLLEAINEGERLENKEMDNDNQDTYR